MWITGMMDVRFMRGAGPLPDATRAAVLRISQAVDTELRDLLPGLSRRVVLRCGLDGHVIPGLGCGGSAIDKRTVEFRIAPAEPERTTEVVVQHLRHTLFHECHHLVRGWVKHDGFRRRFIEAPVAEGLAAAFERDTAGYAAPWCDYPWDVAAWVAELLALPRHVDYRAWMFQHPDGRRWIGYKAGVYIADQAIRRSGQSAAQLVSTPWRRILELAGVV